MVNSQTDPSPSVSRGRKREVRDGWGCGGSERHRSRKVKTRETETPQKAELAVTESDAHFPSFYLRYPFLSSSLFKPCSSSSSSCHCQTKSPRLNLHRMMIHRSPYRIRRLDSKNKLNLNYIFIFDKFVSEELPYAHRVWG